jgi:hypothetical protein
MCASTATSTASWQVVTMVQQDDVCHVKLLQHKTHKICSQKTWRYCYRGHYIHLLPPTWFEQLPVLSVVERQQEALEEQDVVYYKVC